MSSKRIADLPVKNPIDAMKLPTGGFGDYAITLKNLSDWLVNKYSLATKEELANLEVVLKEKIEDEVSKLDVYTKQDVDNIIDKVKEDFNIEMLNLSDDISENTSRLDGLGTTSKYSVENLPTSQPTLSLIQSSITDLGLGTASKKSVEFFAEQEKSASKVILNSERTVEEKTKDAPTLIDFGAKGNKTTNDTQAFTFFESTYKGRTVDLLGLTYLVDNDFSGNRYVNGSLKIVNERTFKTKNLYDKTDYKYRKNAGNGTLFCELSANISVDGTGSTGTSIFQEVVYHPIKNCYYASQEWSGSGSTELMVITKYNTGVGGTISPEKQSLPSQSVGHQGLGLTIENGETYFWTIGGSDIYSTMSRHVTKMQFNEENLSIENVKHFKVFGSEFSGSTVRVMDIAPNMETLVTVGSLSSDGSLVCRVFNVSTFVDEEVDYSNSYTHQFFINKPALSMQSCCTDGSFMYVMHSGDSTYPEYMDIYTLDGVNVLTEKNFTVGYDESRKLTHKYYLPESIFMLPNGQLGFHIAIGKRGGGGTQTPFTNLIMTVNDHSTQVFKTKDDSPSIFLDGTNSFGSTPTQVIRTVEVDETGTQRLRSSQGTNTFNFYPKSSTGGFYVYQDGARDARFFIQNTLRRGMLQVSASGAIGLYDGTNDKWLFFSSASSADTITFNTNLAPSSNNARTLGTSSNMFANTYSKKVSLTPSLYLDTSADAVTGQLRVREVGETDRTRYRVSQSWFEYLILDGSVNGGFSATSGTDTEVRNVIANSLRSIRSQVTSTGNYGIYDSTNSKYLISFDLTGANLNCTTNILPSTTNSKTLGSQSLSFSNTYTNTVTLSTGVTVSTGTVSPEGVVTAPIGSMYIDSVTGDWYQKKSAGTLNTGWVIK